MLFENFCEEFESYIQHVVGFSSDCEDERDIYVEEMGGFSDEINEDIFRDNNVQDVLNNFQDVFYRFYRNSSCHHHEEFVVTNPGEDQFLIE